MALWSQLPLFPHCSGCFWGACSAFCKEKKAIIEVMRTTATGMCQFGSIAVSMAGAMALAMACVAACSTAAFCTPPCCSLFFFAGESDEFQELWESTEEETKRVKAALDRAASAFVSMLAGGGMWGGTGGGQGWGSFSLPALVQPIVPEPLELYDKDLGEPLDPHLLSRAHGYPTALAPPRIGRPEHLRRHHPFA